MFISLRRTLKIANFADTKTQAREGLGKRFQEVKTEHFRAFVPEGLRSMSGNVFYALHRRRAKSVFQSSRYSPRNRNF